MENFKAGEALDLNKTRAEFEAWEAPTAIEKNARGDYYNSHTEARWEGWKARAALALASSAAPAGQQAEPVAMVVKATFGNHKMAVLVGKGQELPIGTKLVAAPASAAPAAPTTEPLGFVAAAEAWMSARSYWQDDEHPNVKAAWGAMLGYLAAPTAAEGPSGYKAVPIEPTQEMINAALDGAVIPPNVRAIAEIGIRRNWRNMLAAAPIPQKEGAGEVDAPKVSLIGYAHVMNLGKFISEGRAGGLQLEPKSAYPDGPKPDEWMLAVYASGESLRNPVAVLDTLPPHATTSIAAQPEDTTDTRRDANA